MYMSLLVGGDIGYGAYKLLVFSKCFIQSLKIMKTILWLMVAIIIALTTRATIVRHNQIYSMLESIMHFNIVFSGFAS